MHYVCINIALPKILLHQIIQSSVDSYRCCYAHTNWFCVVQENIKPEVLKVQTELARSVH